MLHNLGRAVLGNMLGGDDNLGVVGVGNEVHSAAHPLEDFARNHEVGQIPIGTDLQGLEFRVSQRSMIMYGTD